MQKLVVLDMWVVCILKSVRVHFTYGKVALTLEVLGRFGRFLDERRSPYLIKGHTGHLTTGNAELRTTPPN